LFAGAPPKLNPPEAGLFAPPKALLPPPPPPPKADDWPAGFVPPKGVLVGAVLVVVLPKRPAPDVAGGLGPEPNSPPAEGA